MASSSSSSSSLAAGALTLGAAAAGAALGALLTRRLTKQRADAAEPSPGFSAVYGKGLLAELPDFADRPLLVTMADLKPNVEAKLGERAKGSVAYHLVTSLERDHLEKLIADGVGDGRGCVVGVGGGQALDTAKYISWRLRIPLYQFPTALTTDAAFGHRAAVRVASDVRYVGFAVPSAVYIDYDLVLGAPLALNTSGVCDVMCFETGLYDWKLADEKGDAGLWPYDARLARLSQNAVDRMLAQSDDIVAMNGNGVKAICEAHRYGGGAFHAFGWNPRTVEGCEHLFFYALEHRTGIKFIHGQPVGLGIVLGTLLQRGRAAAVAVGAKIAAFGVDVRPTAMRTTWEDVDETLRGLRTFAAEHGHMPTVFTYRDVTDEYLAEGRAIVEGLYASATPK